MIMPSCLLRLPIIKSVFLLTICLNGCGTGEIAELSIVIDKQPGTAAVHGINKLT